MKKLYILINQRNQKAEITIRSSKKNSNPQTSLEKRVKVVSSSAYNRENTTSIDDFAFIFFYESCLISLNKGDSGKGAKENKLNFAPFTLL